MKRKTIALLLALMMCLSLLSACGADSKPDGEPSTATTTPSPTEQPADENKEQPEETEEPAQKPEESEEPAQETHAGTEFLALLQEEWSNGFFEGEGPRHTYNDAVRQPFIYKGVVYMHKVGGSNADFRNSIYSYDIAAKEYKESVSTTLNSSNGNIFFMDGSFYYINVTAPNEIDSKSVRYDCNGELLGSVQQHIGHIFFEKGILRPNYGWGDDLKPGSLWSYELEKIAESPIPQREVEHGLKKDVDMGQDQFFAADGTLYARGYDHFYRLNTDTYQWEDAGDAPQIPDVGIFCGKYATKNGKVFDRVTEEQVFEYGELYPAACGDWADPQLCYFGGDKYLGCKDGEYRWVNLKDLSMSDPLPFPDVHESQLTVLNDTYCVYNDEYGWFLWNYNDGTEETIVLFDK